MRASEEAREHRELVGGIILRLVDHHVLRVGVAQSRHRHVQIQPRACRQVLHAEQAHADAIDAQPFIAFDGHGGVREPFVQVGERARLRLFLGLRVVRGVEQRHLLVKRQAKYLVLHRLGAGHLRKARFQTLEQLFAHERHQVRSRRDVGVFLH